MIGVVELATSCPPIIVPSAQSQSDKSAACGQERNINKVTAYSCGGLVGQHKGSFVHSPYQAPGRFDIGPCAFAAIYSSSRFGIWYSLPLSLHNICSISFCNHRSFTMSKPHKSKNKGTKPTHDAEKPLPKPELSKRDLPFLLRPLKEMPKRPPVVLPPRDLLRCRGVPLNELLTKPLDDLRAIGCFDENVSTKGSEMFIYIELTIAVSRSHDSILSVLLTGRARGEVADGVFCQWPGHHEPRIEVSTRVLSDDCVLVAQLAVEIAKKCPRRIEVSVRSR